MDRTDLQNLKNRYDIIGNDPALNMALEVAVKVAPADLTVLIEGESGAGKENLPKIIHQNSRRKGGKYFAVNCGAIPEGTIDSELFGHEKGAFTGATEMRKGYFEEADGGTLFLDEIAELPLSSQAKLLRVLQEGEFIRVGSNKVLRTDVRVVAATNVDLRFAVQHGKFRPDLYYRLNAVTIKMPSLRERVDDIPLLFRKFTSDAASRYGMGHIVLTPDAVALLKSYRWPGNIRQLKNVAESIAVLEGVRAVPAAGRNEIDASTMARYIPRDETAMPVPVNGGESMNPAEKEMLLRMIYQLRKEVDYLKEMMGTATAAPVKSIAADTSRQVHAASEPATIITPAMPQPQQEEEAEWQDTDTAPQQTAVEDLSIHRISNELILKALAKHSGNRRAAAKELDISERTLYRRIKEINDEKA